jgi:hypothetical protein
MASVSPDVEPEAEPIPVNTTWLEAAQAGQVIYLLKQGPRPPGEVGGVGPDVPNEYLGPRA